MNCKHNLPENICMVCEPGWHFTDKLDADIRPDADRKQPTWCIGCKDHTGRLGHIEPVFVNWKCDRCDLPWLTVRTSLTSVGDCIAAHALSGRKVV